MKKKSQKNPKNTSRCGESNGVKFSQKIVHLVQFAGFEVKQKNMHTKVYKYNVKVVKKELEGSLRLKHVIQTFIQYTLRVFEFKPKKKKI